MPATEARARFWSGNRPQPRFSFLAFRLYCDFVFECGTAYLGSRQRFLDRGRPAAGAGQFLGKR